MRFLLDTNVLSEATRPQPDQQVERWLSARPTHTLFVSVISVAEIRKGILLLPEGKKRTNLTDWLQMELLPAFSGRILPLGNDEMTEWAILQAEAQKTGHVLPVIDSLIAATARFHKLTLATRNIPDFQHCAVMTFNPWEEVE